VPHVPRRDVDRAGRRRTLRIRRPGPGFL